MAVQIRLGDKDRANFGCPEWLDLDLFEATIEELEVIGVETGIDADDWPEAIFPKLRFEDVDKPDAKPRRPAWANRVVVWLALHQSGCAVAWADTGKVVINQIAVRTVPVPKDEADPEPLDSPNSDEPTTPSSATSSLA